MSLSQFLQNGTGQANHQTIWTKSLLTQRFGSDAAMGVIYNPSAYGEDEGGSLFPDGTDAICCTNYAHQVRKALEPAKVRIVGFSCESNPDCDVSREAWHPGGHDFALVENRWLIDPWARLVAGTREQIVYDLHDSTDRALALKTYGNPLRWEQLFDEYGIHCAKVADWNRNGLELMVNTTVSALSHSGKRP